MMVARPEQWVQPMAVAGANQYTFHLEATDGPGALIKDIRENGMKVSAARGRDPRGVARRLARFPTLPPTPCTPPPRQVGLAIKPGTTVEQLAPWANQIDMALVMTVEPGFGGQKFMEDMMPKVSRAPRAGLAGPRATPCHPHCVPSGAVAEDAVPVAGHRSGRRSRA